MPQLPSEGLTAQGAEALGRPLPGDLAALYRLRVPASGGLRLSVLATPEAGRLSVSEPFGSAVSLAAWGGGAAPRLYDLKRGCRLEVRDVSAVLGVAGLPLPEAARLLGGRLPAMDGDAVSVLGPGQVMVQGSGWGAVVQLRSDPWRVVAVSDAAEPSRWRLELARHTLSVPGFVRADSANGDWAELELVRLEWNPISQLPAEPDLPSCPPAER